jgi:hypothetical protein
MNPLEALVGQRLLNIKASYQEVILIFSDSSIAIFNPILAPISDDLIDREVRSIQWIEGEEFSLMFDDTNKIVVSLKESDYSGPEAYCAYLPNGEIVVD